jgi:small-conductance mechanosensitive channel
MDEILKRLEVYYEAFLKAVPRIGLAILILVAGVFIVSWITSLFQKRVKRKSYDPLMSAFLAKAVKVVLIICVFLFTLHVAGLSGIAGAIFATAGASAIVLGFAFKI